MLLLGNLLAELQKATKVETELREGLQQLCLGKGSLFVSNHKYIVSRCNYRDQNIVNMCSRSIAATARIPGLT